MWLIIYVWCVEKSLMACWIIVDVISCLCGCELCNVMKMVIFSLFVWTCHCIILRHGCGSVMCIEKEWYLKEDVPFRGTYRAPRWILYFEGRIAPRWLLLSRVVSCAATDAWTDMSPMGPGLRNSECVSLGQTCIIILDIAFHYIAHTYH